MAQNCAGGGEQVKVEEDTRDKNQNQPFRLLDLPPELWVRCFRLATIANDTIIIDDPDNIVKVRVQVAQPPITRTCKAIRTETITYFYKTARFVIQDNGYLFRGVRRWAQAMRRYQQPPSLQCSIRSPFQCAITVVEDQFRGIAEVSFNGGPLTAGITKVLDFSVKWLNRGDANEEEADGPKL